MVSGGLALVMFDYGKSQKHQIEFVDYRKEVFGVTIDQWITLAGVSVFSMLFFGMPFTVFLIGIAIFVLLKINKLEKLGIPFIYNPKVMRFVNKIPFLNESLKKIELPRPIYRT